MERITPYSTKACAYKRIKITATFERYIEVPEDVDEYEAVDEVIDNLDMSDFDYDYSVVGQHNEIVDVYEA